MTTYCCCLRGELEAGKYVGECLEGRVFDIQLLRDVLDILWPGILHLDVFVMLAIDFIATLLLHGPL